MKSDKKCLVAIYGASSAGKDTVADLLIQYPSFKKVKQWSTRPMRDYETQGNPYHFCTVEEFTEKVLSGDMIEATQYNHWFYGTPESELSSRHINVAIYGKSALKCLIEEQDKYNIFFLEVAAPDKERLIRSLEREKNPDCEEICRRFLSDKKDMSEIEAIYEPEMKHYSMIISSIRTESLINVINSIKEKLGISY